MAHIRLDEQEIELSVGELRIGMGDDAGLRLDAGPGEGNLAIITVDSRGNASVRRAEAGSTVRVNGVALGAEPAPLLHGDRIEVAGRQLRFSDDRKAGHTVLVPALSAPAPAPRAAAAPTTEGERPATAGRLISLVDGREYAVPPEGLRIGRDASADVVVPGVNVSRVHAELVPAPGGYVLRDLSANGVFVNGARTGDVQILRRGDVIRVGDDEFRFYASVTDGVDAVAAHASRPVAPPAPEPAALAVLEVINEGPARGTVYPVRGAVAHVGRGDHNDLVLSDGSVSDSHARIRRRDGQWLVADLGSTNGTYVEGRPVQGEQPLGSGTTVRFGGVKMIFKAASVSAPAEAATRVIVGLKPSDLRSAATPVAVGTPRQQQPTRSANVGRGVPALVWIAAALAIGATVLFVIQDR